MSELRELAAYLDAFEAEPPPMNVGLVAGENLRRGSGLSAAPASGASSQPITWFGASKVQEAIRTQKSITLTEVNGRKVTVLGVPQTVGGRALKPGDQFFHDPGTKKVLAIKLLAQTKSETARAAAPPKPAPSASTYAVSKLQELLRAVGSPASAKLKDGKWGPTTQAEWQRAAQALGVAASSSGKTGATQATVSVAAYNALEQRARAVSLGMAQPLFGAAKPAAAKPAAAPKPAAAKPAQPSKAGLSKVSVATLQDIVTKLGAKIARDGLFGPATKKAWQQSAAKRKLDTAFDRAAPNEAWVHPATLQALAVSAQTAATPPAPVVPKPKTVVKKPAAKSTDPSKTGMTKVNVGQVQDVVRALGSTIKRDGLFGPNTANAWKTAATRRKLDGAIDRAGPIEAWVVPATFQALSAQVGDKKAEPKTAPISAKPPPTPVAPKPGGAPSSNLEPITQAQLALVLSGFGKKPANAAELQLLWAALAKARGLDGNSMTSAKGLEVVPRTRDALITEATLLKNVQGIVARSVASVPVKSFQEALKFANQVDAYKGRFANITVTGTWNKASEDAFFIYFNIPSGNIPMWEKAFPSLVSKDKKAIKLPADFAVSVAKGATNYAQLKTAITKKETADKQVASSAKALDDRISAQVGKASTLISVFALQQALSEIREKQKEGSVPGPVLPGILLTGTWDANTNKGLYESFSDKIWGADTIPAGVWDKVVTRLLVKSASSGVSGLFGVFGDLAQNPQANYIKLPPEVASRVQALAAAFVARSAAKGQMTESKDVQIPVPAGGSLVAGDPILVTGRTAAQEAAPVTGEQIQVPIIESPDGARADIAPGPMPIFLPEPPPAPSPIYVPQPSPAPEPSFAPEPDMPLPAEPFPGASGSTQSVTGPTINIQVPEQQPAEQKSDTAIIVLAGLAGLAAAFLLFQGEREHREQRRNTGSRRTGGRI